MKYSRLGNTDIQISKIGLGTMTWGHQNTEREAHDQLDYALNAGVNFIDTAEMYPVPPVRERYGRTEEIIGAWLKKTGKRDRIILASKLCGASERIDYVRGGGVRLDKKNIEAAVNASLKRLQTDYIDLYQPHWPDRDSNYFGRLNYYHAPDKDLTPIAETLQALDGLVRAGKVRHIGVSNETPWGVAEYLRASRELGLARIVSIQNPYSLLNRTFEIGLAEFAQREQVGLLAYSPLAFGTLSGKYLDGRKPHKARLSLPEFKHYQRYTNAAGIRATADYQLLAVEYDLDPAQMALAFVNSRPFITSNLIGATTPAQLEGNIASIEIELPKDLLRKIEAIHTEQPNPCP